ncbi:hypothetical protein H740_07529 [Campylobacter showae CC57C]|uniref:Uncharacterized protein n=1 Tax=Campylobacter showae CC57C TaxID=1073353 RepID=M3I0U6_9BACT|nr:hypothetical protein H740_07529 [Campylobacter showae CC57C]
MGEFVSKLFRSKKFQMFLVVLCIVLMPALGIIFVNIQKYPKHLKSVRGCFSQTAKLIQASR